MGPYRVLIVDDEEQVRNFIVSLFSKHGHNCETAKDGIEVSSDFLLKQVKRFNSDR